MVEVTRELSPQSITKRQRGNATPICQQAFANGAPQVVGSGKIAFQEVNETARTIVFAVSLIDCQPLCLLPLAQKKSSPRPNPRQWRRKGPRNCCRRDTLEASKLRSAACLWRIDDRLQLAANFFHPCGAGWFGPVSFRDIEHRYQLVERGAELGEAGC